MSPLNDIRDFLFLSYLSRRYCMEQIVHCPQLLPCLNLKDTVLPIVDGPLRKSNLL